MNRLYGYLVFCMLIVSCNPDSPTASADYSDQPSIPMFVINIGGYIGESTKGEIAYAKSQGISVKYLESVDWIIG